MCFFYIYSKYIAGPLLDNNLIGKCYNILKFNPKLYCYFSIDVFIEILFYTYWITTVADQQQEV